MISRTNSLSDMPTRCEARIRSAFSSSDRRVLTSAVSFPKCDVPDREKCRSSSGITRPPGLRARPETLFAASPRARRLPVRAPRRLSCERRYEVA